MGGAGQRGLPVPRLLSLQLPPHRCCIHNGGVRRRGHHIGHATVTCDWYALHSVQPQRGEVERAGGGDGSKVALPGVVPWTIDARVHALDHMHSHLQRTR